MYKYNWTIYMLKEHAADLKTAIILRLCSYIFTSYA